MDAFNGWSVAKIFSHERRFDWLSVYYVNKFPSHLFLLCVFLNLVFVLLWQRKADFLHFLSLATKSKTTLCEKEKTLTINLEVFEL